MDGKSGSLTMHLIILAADKKLACVKKKWDPKCRFCDLPRSPEHMRTHHPDLVAQFYRNMGDEDEKQKAGSEDRVQYRPKWHRYGKRV